jgi:hypothetical protein
LVNQTLPNLQQRPSMIVANAACLFDAQASILTVNLAWPAEFSGIEAGSQI